MQELINACLADLPTCTVIAFPLDYDPSHLDLQGREADVTEFEVVEYRDAAGVILMRHTMPG